ncbi:sn-glycerol-3-phosphate ABC transporter ATP-binding protein UgpC [Paracoccus sp. 1_MG-2023]|uniref:ABC transporter ATP-binding protein n=1 Tax=unclassified Paracoccus (in: a-proteobacteria) TaxID=2688777 RepID=UPI001C09653C|nr:MULTISPECIES: sn-glycerol-3-phosphate ABC transporter ATP-binding protein UgpC [unclassified Paracoccus (in: a-proteobacteria)]MBU2957794.1 sn-glycerol-3-phosphate ABC transporter ATP-binding protein UgpC [Paracoccus sp. C2R09]MDO6667357.1 sn-glycerol-3-phosphate ABC transporter ATP-binding protein UgpC [Paracoccus sp. 1_MG-2023]
MSGVQLNRVTKDFGPVRVIHGVDLKVEQGEFCVFVGPSGCGKSTLLRMIAGLEETSDGQIRIEDDDVTHAEPADRGVAMVFQTYALYPHMTVAENMGFGLKMNRHPKAEIRDKVAEAARILKLEPLLDRKPAALSGGQRQRVAIGRAIVRGPKVFLFDEPLSNLDAELRVEMRAEIARLHREIKATMIYVTHDQVEAMTMADKIVVLRAGRIEQVGAPMHLYDDPDNRFVAGFIGSPSMNFVQGQVKDGRLDVPAFAMPIPHSNGNLLEGRKIEMGLRPDVLKIEGDGPFRVELAENLGGMTFAHLTAPSGEKLVVQTDKRLDPAGGGTVGLTFDPAAAYFFDAETGQRLR